VHRYLPGKPNQFPIEREVPSPAGRSFSSI
jgi:hypothetical protein